MLSSSAAVRSRPAYAIMSEPLSQKVGGGGVELKTLITVPLEAAPWDWHPWTLLYTFGQPHPLSLCSFGVRVAHVFAQGGAFEFSSAR